MNDDRKTTPGRGDSATISRKGTPTSRVLDLPASESIRVLDPAVRLRLFWKSDIFSPRVQIDGLLLKTNHRSLARKIPN